MTVIRRDGRREQRDITTPRWPQGYDRDVLKFCEMLPPPRMEFPVTDEMRAWMAMPIPVVVVRRVILMWPADACGPLESDDVERVERPWWFDGDRREWLRVVMYVEDLDAWRARWPS